MAVLLRDPTGAEYAQSELDLQDRILTVYGTTENEDHMFRPDLADSHKVGFFGQDRTSQTEITEIVDLKEMTEVIQILLQDVATLKRDINFTKHVMKADYESKLQEKSLELYCRINERVSDLEKMHEDRVSTVRRAFRQQLSDAIARVAVLYNKNLQRKVRQEKSKNDDESGKVGEKIKELQATIQRNESIIHMLKMQIAQLQNKEPSIADSPSVAESERPSAITPQTPSFADSPPTTAVIEVRPPSVRERGLQVHIKPPVEEVVVTRSPSVNHEAEALREELESVNQRLEKLQDSLQEKQEESSSLNKEVEKLNDQLTSERMEKEQLKIEINAIKSAVEQDKAHSQKMIAAQKEEMERLMAEKVKAAQMASSQAAEADAKARAQAEKDKMSHLYDQEKKLKEELARDQTRRKLQQMANIKEERAKLAEALQGDTDINKLRKQEQMLRDEVARLKREIERIHKTWEKKFAILQQSLHALKDESYIRQQLQRQAANLHHAAVSYSVDTPIGIMPSSKRGSPAKRPLPDIPKYGKPFNPNATPGAPVEKDYISYTVSAPSGRGTALFSADEHQIMEEADQEDIPEDVVPLPDRPPRNSSSGVHLDVEQIHTPSRGHVIIVPHVS